MNSAVHRTLIVTDSLGVGGMERQLALLATSLPESWAVRVVALAEGDFASVLADAGIDVITLPRAFRFDVRPAFGLAGIIREWRPTVVHSYGWMSATAALPSCRLLGIPLVDASIQDGGVPPRRGRMMRTVVSLADAVIANSRAGLVAYGADPRRGRVVYNGFDPHRWALCGTGDRSTESPTRVVMTARMHPHKDYRTFLEAARVLSAESPGEWQFLAVGPGENRAGLVAEYQDLVDAGVLSFPQPGTEVMGFVRDSSIGVLLTNPDLHAEGIPNSIMEYMACGLPVVATDSGGNAELVVQGETGLLVPPCDTEAVVDALSTLRDNPEDANRMGRAGRARIADVFTLDALVEGTLAVYDLALQRRSGR